MRDGGRDRRWRQEGDPDPHRAPHSRVPPTPPRTQAALSVRHSASVCPCTPRGHPQTAPVPSVPKSPSGDRAPCPGQADGSRPPLPGAAVPGGMGGAGINPSPAGLPAAAGGGARSGVCSPELCGGAGAEPGRTLRPFSLFPFSSSQAAPRGSPGRPPQPGSGTAAPEDVPRPPRMLAGPGGCSPTPQGARHPGAVSVPPRPPPGRTHGSAALLR